jgi:amino acid transporter
MKQGKISFLAAVLMSVNIIAGVGIYFGPPLMASKVGSFSFLGWAAAGLLLFPIIWCIALAAKMFPGKGGFYNYGKKGVSDTFGFIAAWSYLLGFIALGVTQATVLKESLANICNISLTFTNHLIFDVVIIVLFSVLNLLSVTLISRIQSSITVFKLLPLFVVITIFAFYWNPSLTYFTNDFMQLHHAIPIGLFGYLGVESCVNIGHLIEGGTTKVFGVILTAFTFAILLYSLFHFGILHIMGTNNLVSMGVENFPQFLGIKGNAYVNFARLSISWILIISYANAVYGVILSNIANISSMAQNRMLFMSQRLQQTNKFGRPTWVVILTAFLFLSSMIYINKKEILLAIANIGIVATFFMISFAVFCEQFKKNESLFKLGLTGLSFISSTILAYFSWLSIATDNVTRSLYSMPFFCGLVAGIIMYKYKKTKKQITIL